MRPDIYFFNPTCELAIANASPHYTAPARLRKLEEDLAYLPVWLGREEDEVLVNGILDSQYMDRMRALGFKLATPVGLAAAFANPKWLGQPKGRLIPWGWSPAVSQLFQPVWPMFANSFGEYKVAGWQPFHKQLYSRLTGIAMLKSILTISGYPWFPDLSAIPVACDSLAAIFGEVEKYDKSVVKTPWSSSGRGLLLFPNIDSRMKNEEVLSGMLKQQGFVTVEPWHQKLMDLSYQFQSEGGKIHYRGRTIFETDQKGRYQRNFLRDSPASTAEINNFLAERNDEVISLLSKALAESDYVKFHEGWIGVDALIYQSAEGSLRFHPLVEINGRLTMGAIALKIRSYLADESTGFMQIFYSGSSNFLDFCQRKEVEKPLIMKNHKIVSGFLPLTPPLRAHHFGAYIECENWEM
jgi:hypothetical protein